VRVLHVLESMVQGGAESLVVEHVRRAGPGIQTLVCALNRGGPALEEAGAAGAPTFLLSKHGRRAGAVRRLARLMREERITVVNGHNPSGALYATLAAAWAGVPVVFRTEHSFHYPGRHSAFYPGIETLITACTRRVVCVCQAVLESHVSRLPWAARRFVTVVNGISPAPHTRARADLRRELGLDPGARVVLSVGSLSRQKAQQVLLEAFARATSPADPARLLLAGEGPLRAALEERIHALGLGGRVLLLGPRRDVADLMSAAELFALSSEREGLPVTVLEAMRAGLPVAATRAGGTGEAVEDGVTGRLVAVGDAAALGAALAELLGDAGARAAMGAAGRARWNQRFTAERMVRETEELYQRELASRPRRAATRSSMGAPHASA
jgi:glycosyltransferase involved in cell wall biosynthesis